MKLQLKPNRRHPQHSRRNPLKSAIDLLLALSLGGALANVRAADANSLPGLGVQPVEYFYTGKPYDADSESYTFQYRNYDPVLNRWTTADPSGFPDGTNNRKYVASPTHQLDCAGLFALSTTTPSVSDVTDSIAGYSHAVAWDLLHIGANSSAATTLQGLIAGNTSISSIDLTGNVSATNFYVQNHSSSQSQNNPKVGSVNLTLTFNNQPTGFGWIQMQRIRTTGSSQFSQWQLDISSGAGPAYTAGPILNDTPAVGVFPTNSGDSGERQLYTFAATYANSTWTIYDGIYWGGEVFE